MGFALRDEEDFVAQSDGTNVAEHEEHNTQRTDRTETTLRTEIGSMDTCFQMNGGFVDEGSKETGTMSRRTGADKSKTSRSKDVILKTPAQDTEKQPSSKKLEVASSREASPDPAESKTYSVVDKLKINNSQLDVIRDESSRDEEKEGTPDHNIESAKEKVEPKEDTPEVKAECSYCNMTKRPGYTFHTEEDCPHKKRANEPQKFAYKGKPLHMLTSMNLPSISSHGTHDSSQFS